MQRWRYEDAERPWEPDDVLLKYEAEILRCASLGFARDRQDDQRPHAARALDLGMGYGRNAVWLAERGYEVEAWEIDGRYIREAGREWRRRCAEQREQSRGARPRPGPRQTSRGGPPPARGEERERNVAPRGATHKVEAESWERPGRLRVRGGDFGRMGWARGGRRYDVIVISQSLHQLKRSAALEVLRGAKAALAPGGRLFLLAKLTRDKHVRRVAGSEEWKRARGERNTWRRVVPRGRRKFHPGRPRRRWTLLSALTGGEIRRVLRGLNLAHYREVTLRSDWREVEAVTHTVAEVVAERN